MGRGCSIQHISPGASPSGCLLHRLNSIPLLVASASSDLPRRRAGGRSSSSAARRFASSIGSVNLPVVCAGVAVKPGDVVVADDDGVVIVPRADAAKVAKAGEEREKKEAGSRARLQKGELGLDIYDMRKTLADKGLKYLDGPLE